MRTSQGARARRAGAGLRVQFVAMDARRHEHSVEAAIAPWRRDQRFTWERVEPSLEDIFIHLMAPYRGKA